MKNRRQPLSEAFVYGSPERMPGFSFRWTYNGLRQAEGLKKRERGGRDERKSRN
ncbi:MAG: hypothetical protein ABW104_10010 [Candidatus Thiodiazotropha sp. 6PLUC2]